MVAIHSFNELCMCVSQKYRRHVSCPYPYTSPGVFKKIKYFILGGMFDSFTKLKINFLLPKKLKSKTPHNSVNPYFRTIIPVRYGPVTCSWFSPWRTRPPFPRFRWTGSSRGCWGGGARCRTRRSRLRSSPPRPPTAKTCRGKDFEPWMWDKYGV